LLERRPRMTSNASFPNTLAAPAPTIDRRLRTAGRTGRGPVRTVLRVTWPVSSDRSWSGHGSGAHEPGCAGVGTLRVGDRRGDTALHHRPSALLEQAHEAAARNDCAAECPGAPCRDTLRGRRAT